MPFRLLYTHKEFCCRARKMNLVIQKILAGRRDFPLLSACCLNQFFSLLIVGPVSNRVFKMDVHQLYFIFLTVQNSHSLILTMFVRKNSSRMFTLQPLFLVDYKVQEHFCSLLFPPSVRSRIRQAALYIQLTSGKRCQESQETFVSQEETDLYQK